MSSSVQNPKANYCHLGVKRIKITYKKLEKDNCDKINRLPKLLVINLLGGILIRFVLSLTEALMLSWAVSCLENIRRSGTT